MKKPQELAVIFAHIAEVAGTLESHAAQMLAAIKLAGCDHLEEFNAMVSEAYAKNSWSQVQGRPSAESTLKPAPDAVKLYVSTVRAAIALSFKSRHTKAWAPCVARSKRSAPKNVPHTRLSRQKTCRQSL